MTRRCFIHLEWHGFPGGSLIIPELVDRLDFPRASQAQIHNILSVGDVSAPSFQGLATVSIDSQFSQRWIDRYIEGGFTARQYNDYLHIWQRSREPARLVIVSDIPTYATNVMVLCEYRNREIDSLFPDDIHYRLDLIEYVPHEVQTLQMIDTPQGIAVEAPPPPVVNVPPSSPETYTVVRGDTLWGIAQRFSGNGANWRELYELNQDVIHARAGAHRQGNLIFPGQVFRLPDSW